MARPNTGSSPSEVYTLAGLSGASLARKGCVQRMWRMIQAQANRTAHKLLINFSLKTQKLPLNSNNYGRDAHDKLHGIAARTACLARHRRGGEGAPWPWFLHDALAVGGRQPLVKSTTTHLQQTNFLEEKSQVQHTCSRTDLHA